MFTKLPMEMPPQRRDSNPWNSAGEYIVLDGLSSGDIIVSEGVGLIREGQQIKVRQAGQATNHKKESKP